MTPDLHHFRLDDATGGPLTIWIDVAGRPVNALGDAVFAELETVLEHVVEQPRERVILLRSAKPTNFIVGADLKQIAGFTSADEAERFLQRGQQLFDRLRELPQRTVAVIHGACLGGGLELALACDYRFACNAPKTQLGLPETKLGLIPGWGGTQDLPRLIGLAPALVLLISGDAIAAPAALQLGLVDRLGEADSLEDDLRRFIALIPSQSSRPHRLGNLSRWLERILPFSWYIPDEQTLDELRGPAISTLLEVVRAGWPNRRSEGLAAERSRFYKLVASPAVQTALARFAKPKKSD